MINQIKISNYKSIVESEAKLPSFGAIVGENAVGKTNLIQCIDIVRELVIGEKLSETTNRFSLIPYELVNINSEKKNIEFSVSLCDINENKYILDISIKIQEAANKFPEWVIDKEILTKIIKNKSCEVLYKRTGKILEDSSKKMLQIDTNRLAISIYPNSDAARVKKIFENTHVNKLDTISLRHPLTSLNSKSESLSNLLAKMKYSNRSKFKKFSIIAKKILPHLSYFFRDFDSESVKKKILEEEMVLVLFQEKKFKKAMSVMSLSDGDIKTLFILASAIDAEKGGSLIIEEIENGMQPGRIKDLVERLKQISNIQSLQILFTTHSPVVINCLSPGNVVKVIKNSEKGTIFKPLSEISQLSKVQKALEEGVDLNDILSGLK